MRVGIARARIKETFRNAGYSYGLEHDLVYRGHLIWSRSTGRVVHVEDGADATLAEMRASGRCRIMNGVAVPGPADVDAFDQTP